MNVARSGPSNAFVPSSKWDGSSTLKRFASPVAMPGNQSAANERAAPVERRDRGGEELERVPRRQVDPPRDREQTAWLEMIEVRRQTFDRVEIAFGQRVTACGRRAGRIEQRNLDQVIARAAPCDEAARLGDMDAHGRRAVGAAREIGEAALDQLDDERILL